jgi:sec-independent protein translocase protein TatA
MPFNIGAPELLIILVLALIIFGPGRLPEVGSALGRTIREFRRSSNEVDASDASDRDRSSDKPKHIVVTSNGDSDRGSTESRPAGG